MPAARYWRVVGVECYGRATLSLAEFGLYAASVRVDSTPNATIPPDSGALTSLSDANNASVVSWSDFSVAMPGFALVWDLGSVQSVDELRISGPSASEFIYAMTVQYSSDGVSWNFMIDYLGIRYPGVGSLVSLSLTEYIDRIYSKVGLLLKGNAANGSTTITDYGPNALTTASNSGVVNSNAQSKFGGYSLKFSAGKQITYSGTIFSSGSTTDSCFEFWIYVEAFPTSTQNFVSGSGAAGWGLSMSPAGVMTCTNVTSTSMGTIAVGGWHHIAIVHRGWSGNAITRYIYLDGVQVGIAGLGPPWDSPYMVAPVFGSTDTTMVFYLDDVRTTTSGGAFSGARYTGAFTPPTLEFAATAGAYTFRTVGSTSSGGYALNRQPIGSTHMLANQPQNMVWDSVDFGKYKISGTVKEKASPDNLPLMRRVRLFTDFDGRFIRETWSDPATGAYAFNNISNTSKYSVVSYDHTHNYKAVIADNLSAELMT